MKSRTHVTFFGIIGAMLLIASPALSQIPRLSLPAVPSECTLENCNQRPNCACCFNFGIGCAGGGSSGSSGSGTTRTGDGGSCFIAGTLVQMEDGSTKAIETLTAGDRVMGNSGVNTVVGMETPKLGARLLYAFNGGKAFVTSEHPFMTQDGWKSIDPDATAHENPALRVGRLQTGDIIITRSASIRITSITEHIGAAESLTYNPLLDGDHTYFADDYLVHNKDGGSDGGGGDGGGGGG